MRLLCGHRCWLFAALIHSVVVEASASASPSTSKNAPGLTAAQRETEVAGGADGGLMRREPLVEPVQSLAQSVSARDRKARRIFKRRSRRRREELNASASLLMLSGSASVQQHQAPLVPQAPIALIPAFGQLPNLQVVQSMPYLAVPIAQPQTVQMIVQAQAPVAAAPVAAAPPVATVPTAAPPPATQAPAAASTNTTDGAASYDDSDGNVEHRISMTTLLCIILSGTIVALYVAWRNLRKVYELRRGGDLLSEMVLGLTGDGADGRGLFARVSVVSAYFGGAGGENDDTRSRSEKESEDSDKKVVSRAGGRHSLSRGRASMAGADVAAGGPEADVAPKAAATSYRERKSRTRQSLAGLSNAAETGAEVSAGDDANNAKESSYRDRRSRGVRGTTPPTGEVAPPNEAPQTAAPSRSAEEHASTGDGTTPAAKTTYRDRKSRGQASRETGETQPTTPAPETTTGSVQESRRERSRVRAQPKASPSAPSLAETAGNQLPPESSTAEADRLAAEKTKAEADRQSTAQASTVEDGNDMLEF